MKCPQCSFAISSNRDVCPRCKLDLTEFKRKLGVKTTRLRPAAVSERKPTASPQQPQAPVSPPSSQATKAARDPEAEFLQAAQQLETIASEEPQSHSAYRSSKPKDDISDLLEALGELREGSLVSRDLGGMQEIVKESSTPEVPVQAWHAEDSLLASEAEKPKERLEQLEESLFGAVQEAQQAAESLLEEFEDVLESDDDEQEVDATINAEPLPRATTTGSFPAQSITPEVIDFSESEDLFEETLDEMIGDLVFDIEAVRTEKKQAKPSHDESTLLYDDVEISIEIEIEDDDDDDEVAQDSDDEDDSELVKTQAMPAQPIASDDPLDGLMASFQALESHTQEHKIAHEDMTSGSSGKSPTVHDPMPAAANAAPTASQASGNKQALPDSVRATLRAARNQSDPSVKRLAALLAQAYGVELDKFEEQETIDSLEAELDEELGALMSEGTSFFGLPPEAAAAAVEAGPQTDESNPELQALESELLHELDALREAGITLSGAQVEAPPQAVAESAPENDELASLSQELDHELEELEAEMRGAASDADIAQFADRSEFASEVAEELHMLDAQDETADEIAALTNELSEELEALESSIQEYAIAESVQSLVEEPDVVAAEAPGPEGLAGDEVEGMPVEDEYDSHDTVEANSLAAQQAEQEEEEGSKYPSFSDLPVARVITLDNRDSEEDAPVSVQTGQFFVSDLERMSEEAARPTATEDEAAAPVMKEPVRKEPVKEEMVMTGQFLISDLNRLSGAETEVATSSAEEERISEEDELNAFMDEVSFAEEGEDAEPATPPAIALTGQFLAADLAQLEADSEEFEQEPTTESEEATIEAGSESEEEFDYSSVRTGAFLTADLEALSESAQDDMAAEAASGALESESTAATDELEHTDEEGASAPREETAAPSPFSIAGLRVQDYPSLQAQRDAEEQASDSSEEHVETSDELEDEDADGGTLIDEIEEELAEDNALALGDEYSAEVSESKQDVSLTESLESEQYAGSEDETASAEDEERSNELLSESEDESPTAEPAQDWEAETAPLQSQEAEVPTSAVEPEEFSTTGVSIAEPSEEVPTQWSAEDSFEPESLEDSLVTAANASYEDDTLPADSPVLSEAQNSEELRADAEGGAEAAQLEEEVEVEVAVQVEEEEDEILVEVDIEEEEETQEGEEEVLDQDLQEEQASEDPFATGSFQAAQTGEFLAIDFQQLEAGLAELKTGAIPDLDAEDSLDDEEVEESEESQTAFAQNPRLVDIPDSLWVVADKDVRAALAASTGEIELNVGEVVAFQKNERINVLFEAVDEEIVDPSKKKRHSVEVVRKQPQKVDNSSLNQAFKSFEKEAVEVAKEKRARKERGADFYYTEVSEERASGVVRAIAALIDTVVMLGIGALASVLIFAPLSFFSELAAGSVDPSELWLYGFRIALTSYIVWLLLSTMQTATFGRTFGGRLFGIAVVTREGDPLDVRRALLRAFGSTVSLLSLGLGFIPAFFGKSSVHDALAHTVVVKSE